MNKTELLNRMARDGEERLLLARLLDKLELSRRRDIPSYTGFLSASERVLAESLIHAAGCPEHVFFGGYEEAERTICVFLPSWMGREDWITGGECPLSAVRCMFPAGSHLTHRDFLGAVLGLGVTREKVGDLLVGTDFCDVIVLQELEEYLLLNLESAGRVKLKCSRFPLDQLIAPQVRVKVIRDTVAALRLDAVTASAFSLSRSKAASAVSAGRVQLNHRECVKPDQNVAEGDVLSCRGLGKCVVKEAGSRSKKGRIMIVLERCQ